MNWALFGVPALALAGACIAGSVEALASEPVGPGAVKSGQWEFAAQLQPHAAAPPAAGAQPQSGTSQPLGGMQSTYTACITSDRAVPAELGPQCRLGDTQRQGARITWSMTCTNPQSSVRSDGVAQYHGDTMEATLVNHVPGASGAVTDVTQRITGRYLGPCTQATQGPMTPLRPAARPNARPSAAPSPAANPTPTAAPNAPADSPHNWVEPPAASGTAKPPAAAAPRTAGESAEAAAPEPPPHRRRYVGHRRYHRYYYGRGGWPSGGGLLGIRLPFIGGL